MNKQRLCDTHNDFLSELDENQIPSYLSKIKESGVKIVSASFWTSEIKKKDVFKKLEPKAEIISGRSDCLLHIEDLHFVTGVDKLERLINLKPFSCSLTWNRKNALACGSRTKGGVSLWGRCCAEKLIENGIIIDVAHLNRESFYEISEIVKNYIYCSHTGFCGIKDHRRNLTDEQVDKIVSSNGYIGLFFFDKCIKKGGSFVSCDVIADNLKYFTSHFGYDNIGIGSDFYGMENYPKDLKSYDDFGRLSFVLREKGFSEKQIDKIFYQNFIDYLNRVKPNCF